MDRKYKQRGYATATLRKRNASAAIVRRAASRAPSRTPWARARRAWWER